MAASCPKCGSIIDQDFGVAACTKCQAVLFIDMDGNAQLAEESSDNQAPVGLELPSSEEPTRISTMSYPEELSPLESPVFDPVFESHPVVLDGPSLEESVVEMSSVPEEKHFGAFEHGTQSLEMPEMEMAEAAPIETSPITEEQIHSLAEIEPEGTGVFESSEQVLGGLSYSVKIENIDTKQLRIQMIEALDDSRFQWDPREVLKTVKAGTLELKNLNPVKASVVIQRMKELSVKISWEQHVYN